MPSKVKKERKEMIKTVKQKEIAEIEEKKSKFIAQIFPVEKEEQIKEILQEIKKGYKNANHYAYAYRILKEEIIEKMSDDGEPSLTAGLPILKHLQGKELTNVLLVVTRYFGGILLGTGGLTKAYGESSKKVLDKVEIQYQELGYEVELEIDYTDLVALEYEVKQKGWKVEKKFFLENVIIQIFIPKINIEEITNNGSNKSFKIKKYAILREKIC